MTVINFRSDYDRRMDNLALRLGETMDGEKPVDCMMACASIIGFVLRDAPSSAAREKTLARIVEFIRKVAEHP